MSAKQQADKSEHCCNRPNAVRKIEADRQTDRCGSNVRIAEWFGHDRFGLQLSVGTLPHEKVMKAIELLGTVVKPAVNKALRTPSPAA